MPMLRKLCTGLGTSMIAGWAGLNYATYQSLTNQPATQHVKFSPLFNYHHQIAQNLPAGGFVHQQTYQCPKEFPDFSWKYEIDENKWRYSLGLADRWMTLERQFKYPVKVQQPQPTANQPETKSSWWPW